MKNTFLKTLMLASLWNTYAQATSCYEYSETTTRTKGNFEVNLRDYTLLEFCGIDTRQSEARGFEILWKTRSRREKAELIAECKDKVRAEFSELAAAEIQKKAVALALPNSQLNQQKLLELLIDELFKNKQRKISIDSVTTLKIGDRDKWVETEDIFQKLHLRPATKKTIELFQNSQQPQMSRTVRINDEDFVVGILEKDPLVLVPIYRSINDDLSKIKWSGYYGETRTTGIQVPQYLERDLPESRLQLLVNKAGDSAQAVILNHIVWSNGKPKLAQQIRGSIGEDLLLKIQETFFDGRTKTEIQYHVGCR